MHPSVQAQFRAFNEPFEGVIPHMYLDIKGLVTVGVGNLIDPVDSATALPFRFKNKPGIATTGAPASKAQIAAEWQKLKNNRNLAHAGHCACEPITDLELDDDAVNTLIAQRLTANETFLKRQQPFKQFDLWPGDAQMALLSMAWAMGPAGALNFHKFCASCEKLDFAAAALQCKMNEAGNPGVIPRNRANSTLLSNAAVVLAAGLQCSTLFYPKLLSEPA
jgi:GH24 family phage-related lysozyme (muramidase)